MKPISGRRMCRVLERHGWVLLRITSSHHIYGLPGIPGRDPISVPVHRNQDLGTGLQGKIMRQAGLTDADL